MPRKRRKKSSLANFTKKVATRKRKNAALVGNPGLATDLASRIVPGIAAYAATRVGGRILYGVTSKRYPKFGKHAGPLGTVAAAAALWLSAHKVQRLAPYHDPIVVGASIAAAQTILQTYIPQYGWIMNDWHLDAAKKARGLPTETETFELPNATAAPAQQLPDAGPSSEFDISDIVDDDYAGSLSGGLLN
jgi:hypothetical protein